MKRIIINLDLENNEVLSKEIESMIKATAEHRFKGYIDSIEECKLNICEDVDKLIKEVQRMID